VPLDTCLLLMGDPEPGRSLSETCHTLRCCLVSLGAIISEVSKALRLEDAFLHPFLFNCYRCYNRDPLLSEQQRLKRD
jgi:hypothetical protein